jgi:hypothetical protein
MAGFSKPPTKGQTVKTAINTIETLTLAELAGPEILDVIVEYAEILDREDPARAARWLLTEHVGVGQVLKDAIVCEEAITQNIVKMARAYDRRDER